MVRETESKASDILNTIRLFSGSIDFSDNDGDRWLALRYLTTSLSNQYLLISALRMWGAEIKNNPVEDAYARVQRNALSTDHLKKEATDRMLKLMGEKAFEARCKGCGYPPLLMAIATGSQGRDFTRVPTRTFT